jgi:hypothetical protein
MDGQKFGEEEGSGDPSIQPNCSKRRGTSFPQTVITVDVEDKRLNLFSKTRGMQKIRTK